MVIYCPILHFRFMLFVYNFNGRVKRPISGGCDILNHICKDYVVAEPKVFDKNFGQYYHRMDQLPQSSFLTKLSSLRDNVYNIKSTILKKL